MSEEKKPTEDKKPSLNIAVITTKMTLFEPILGSAPNNPNIYREFIATKDPEAKSKPAKADEEASTLPAFDVENEIGKSTTVFHRDSTGLFLYDYQLRGFLKEAVLTLINAGLITTVSKWTHKKAVDSAVFVAQRRCYLIGPDGSPFKVAAESLSRPLRAETMQGERVTLANSEMLPAGTHLTATFGLLLGTAKAKSLDLEQLKNCFTYGSAKGLGQWRNGSYGRFQWEELATPDEVYDLPSFAIFKMARDMMAKASKAKAKTEQAPA